MAENYQIREILVNLRVRRMKHISKRLQLRSLGRVYSLGLREAGGGGEAHGRILQGGSIKI